MAIVNVDVNVDVDLDDFETEDLISALKARDDFPWGDLDFEEFIRDCRRAFEQKDPEEFEYLMRKLEREAGI